jgi:hypothetical protein
LTAEIPDGCDHQIAFLFMERDTSRRWSLRVMNAIQEAIAQWGNRVFTTAPTVSAM